MAYIMYQEKQMFFPKPFYWNFTPAKFSVLNYIFVNTGTNNHVSTQSIARSHFLFYVWERRLFGALSVICPNTTISKPAIRTLVQTCLWNTDY